MHGSVTALISGCDAMPMKILLLIMKPFSTKVTSAVALLTLIQSLPGQCINIHACE